MHRSRLGCVLAAAFAVACAAPDPDPAGLYCAGGSERPRPLGDLPGVALDTVAASASGADVRLVAGPRYQVAICARVGEAGEDGRRRVRVDVEGRPSSTGAIEPEAQALRCEGEARTAGRRLVVERPRCCEGDDCLARAEDECAYDEVRPIALSLRSDGVALEPFRVRRAERCGERATLGARVGAERLARATVR